VARIADTNADIGANADIPALVPGRCREGLDEWLEGLLDVDAPALVAHCRVLADEVDRDPRSSALHGRYTAALAGGARRPGVR
jgi:hypothetical protein